MHGVPTKRLIVYIAAGLIVLLVGVAGLVAMRGGGKASSASLVLDAATPATGSSGSAAAGASPVTAEAVSTTTTVATIWVQVAGAVGRPGVYQLSADARVVEAVLAAGGFTADADQQATAMAARLSDGCRVYIPKTGEPPAGQAQAPAQSSAGVSPDTGAGSTQSSGTGGLISLNTATVEQLDSLPGVGPSLARQIVAYREAKGPFTSVDQLDDVPGIGPAKLEQLRPLVSL